MIVTPSGIVIEVNLSQPENAPLPMLVTLLGIVIEVKPLQPLNALLPMLVTLFGIITEVNFEHKENALSAIPTTSFGIDNAPLGLISLYSMSHFLPSARETYIGSPSFIP